jgi:hypothetical protein
VSPEVEPTWTFERAAIVPSVQFSTVPLFTGCPAGGEIGGGLGFVDVVVDVDVVVEVEVEVVVEG